MILRKKYNQNSQHDKTEREKKTMKKNHTPKQSLKLDGIYSTGIEHPPVLRHRQPAQQRQPAALQAMQRADAVIIHI